MVRLIFQGGLFHLFLLHVFCKVEVELFRIESQTFLSQSHEYRIS